MSFWTVIVILLSAMGSHGEETSPPEFSPEITLRPDQSLKPSLKDKKHPTPLYFDVVGAGVELLPLEFDYDLETADGNGLRLGNIQIDAGNFFVDLVPLVKLEANLTRVLPNKTSSEYVFLFRWPDYVLRKGTLEMISRTGRVLWSQEIDQQKQETWKNQLNLWKTALVRARFSAADIQDISLFRVQYGIRDVQRQKTPFWDLTESFRFCFSHKETVGQTRICTAWMEVIRNKKQISFASVPLSPQPPRVIVMNEQGKLADRLQVTANRPVQFYAELRSGMSYEFLATPHKLNIIDMVEDRSGQGAVLISEGDEPLAPSTLLNQRSYSPFMKMIGWQQTIGDLRKFWRTKMSLKNPMLMISGSGGGVFSQRFIIKSLPREEHRPYLDVRTVDSTYIDGVKVFGVKQKELGVNSTQNLVKVDQANPMDFVWEFGAKTRGELNRSYLWVTDGDRSFRAYHEIYKGYPRELSARLSGIVGSENNILILGEVAFNYWFEDLLGWTHYYLSRHRWGMSAKGFRSLTDLKISTKNTPLQVTTLDLKYRLEPGLWVRDETWGLIGGYQNVDYDQFKISMLGVGLFWARSMPKVFDDIANLFPFMNYPKWVDMEFIYYLAPNSDSYKLKGMGSSEAGLGNWQLNFHGQVMWTKTFFGEAGFGLKQYDILKELSTGRRTNFTFTSFYGTAGIGYRF